MKLSICVVNYYSGKQLDNFLNSLMDFRPDCLHEVIVVDHGSAEGLRHLPKQYGDWVRVISPQKNLGYGAGQNRAVKQAKGEYVMLCNPDLELQDESLRSLLHFAEKQKKLGIVGPQLVYSNGGIQESCRKFPRMSDLVLKRLGLSRLFKARMKEYLMSNVDRQNPSEVDWLVGAAMLMKRDFFEELGGFDERFFLFFEDTDLCRRTKEAGREVTYFPGATMVHTRQRLSQSHLPGMWIFKKTFWIHLVSAMKYFKKWGKSV